MPTLPLYDLRQPTDASHRVTSPGGYEWWYFDAEDASADVQVVAILFQGFVFHPGYLRRYAAYVRTPTRKPPPLPAEYPCAYFALYQKGALAAQYMTQFPQEQFFASSQETNVVVGPNRLVRHTDESLHLSLRGRPWRVTWRGPRINTKAELSAELAFRPKFPHRPHEGDFLSRELTGADHRWVIADPSCEVEGIVRLPGHSIQIRGRGYHDHNYGSGPIGAGVRHWMWGRVLDDARTISFQVAVPRDQSRKNVVRIVAADVVGVHELEKEMVALEGTKFTPLGLKYPRIVRLPGVTFGRPRVLDGSPFYLRLSYERLSGPGPAAFCEIAYPHRLRWPVLGRMIEMSIDKRS